jgi:nucleoside-diphosphate-sugar epimerase
VVCSSFGAVGLNPDGASDETHTVNPFDELLDYEMSKAVMEVEVQRAVGRGQDVVIVNPCGVVGPNDYRPSSLGQTIVDFANRRLPAYMPGCFELVAVRDVVQGHLLAMDKGRRGERYILGAELRTLDSVLDTLAAIVGRPKPRVRIPPRVMLPLSYVTNFLSTTFAPDRALRYTPGTIRLLHSGKRADWSKAKRELGYQPTSVDAALAEALECFVRRGLVHARA